LAEKSRIKFKSRLLVVAKRVEEMGSITDAVEMMMLKESAGGQAHHADQVGVKDKLEST
jgi:hypothetical protein